MSLDSAKVLEYIKSKYPDYKPIKINDFKRAKRFNWVSKIGYNELHSFGPVAAQIQAVIDTGAVKFSVFMRNTTDESILIPDIDLEQLRDPD